MKYIRTKDIDTLIVDINQKDFIKEEYIVKEADTIEELCDELVIICNKAFTKPMLYDLKDLNMLKKDVWYSFNSYNWEYQVYGAIWTDKGLTYVAKLNKKGEWELI